MGIKGIYKELGPGRRISLSKLAADSLESTNRPYRIAVDIAIWQFQTQAARGGTNPAIRTLFYRLVRLLGTPIQPIFVFDGPNKPAFKRNKRSGRGDGVATAMAKRLISLFGFPIHDAPGEGEAECALLQQRGVVDAVLSEDVDTIMFGCTRTLRDWSAEGKTPKSPTHISLYDIHDMALENLGLDREGMVLVALMSGGDYLPDGVPGCGVKVACEAAKAGFGKSVCRLKASDTDGIQAWRESLIHELQTNEKGYFKTKHKALKIPQDFPNLEVLRYYTHPVVSPESNIEKARQKLEQKQELHLAALREFTRETFDWDYRIGAIKFIRVLGQALLVKHMIESKDTSHVKRISGRRTHFSTDGTPELRLAYIPEEVVPIDLAGEVDETVNYGRTGLALNSDDEYDGLGAIEDAPVASAPKVFDVTKPDLAWVLEGLVKKSAPGVLREWQVQEQARAVRRSPTKKKAGVAKAVKHPDMPRGSLDKFLTVTKTTVSNPRGSSKTVDPTLLKSPTRPKIRTNPSKQSSSSPTRSPRKSTAIQEIDSSPITPRFSRSQKQPETILISSSPLGPVSCTSPASTFPPCSSSHAAPTLSSSGTVPQSIRSILQATRSSESLDTSPRRNRHQRHVEPVPSGSGFKQPSITTFLDSSKSNGTEREATRKAVEVDSDSDLEPIYSLAKPGLSVKEIPQKQATRHNEEPAGTMGHPAPTKKLFRARASGSGFIEEVELSAEEREAELNSKSGKKSSMVRWSDVSIIDLTQPDS